MGGVKDRDSFLPGGISPVLCLFGSPGQQFHGTRVVYGMLLRLQPKSIRSAAVEIQLSHTAVSMLQLQMLASWISLAPIEKANCCQSTRSTHGHPRALLNKRICYFSTVKAPSSC
jgi:hypothetical protein